MDSNFPKYVMIQTTSSCNGGCSFCPYPEIKDELTHGVMEDWLYKKIIDECSQYRVERIMPYRYLCCESLTDSAGDGQFRGAIGCYTEYLNEQDPETFVSGDALSIPVSSASAACESTGMARCSP